MRSQSASAGSSASQTPSRLKRMSLRTAWNGVRKALGLGGGGGSELPPPPPDEEPALVGAGPPKRPSPSTAAALEIPEDPTDTDARGHEA
jgi:hypothetical protein